MDRPGFGRARRGRKAAGRGALRLTWVNAWNGEITNWETKAKVANVEAKKRYRDELDKLDAQREKAQYTLKLLEGASTAAWGDLRSGVDEARDRMLEAMKQARSHFERASRQ
jgi:hypothetical protein